MECCLAVTPWAVTSRQRRMDIGMGRTREGAGYLRT